MRRRTMLTFIAGSMGFVAGCPSQSDAGPESSSTPTTTAVTDSSTPTRTQTPTPAQTETPRQNPDTIFVAPNGSPTNPGTRDHPLSSIQEGFNRAGPGHTIYALPGDYPEAVRTQRDGSPGQPITLTGPPDAVFRGDPTPEYKSGLHIEHSHIHIRGLTFDGLSDPEHPERPDSYIDTLIGSRHAPNSDPNYHEDLVIKPHAIKNSFRPAIHVTRSKNVEIGEFTISGPTGISMLQFGDEEHHNGEVVYIGTAPGTIPLEGEGPSWATDIEYEPDRSSNIHVHHIDNSAGYPHAELVDVKAGCHNVVIEYCTDSGEAGSYIEPSRDQDSGTAIRLGGREVTVRWNRIAGSKGNGIKIGNWGLVQPEAFRNQNGRSYPDSLTDHGRSNAIYGNQIQDCANLAIRYLMVYPDDGPAHIANEYGPDDQKRVCGNAIRGKTHGNPDSECEGSVPTTDKIGHLGGDSPWA